MTDPLKDAWFVLVSLMFLAFLLLDGFDLGLGMAFPFAFRDKADRKAVLDAVWPFWDGNELWAVIGGASLLAVFTPVFVGLVGGLAPIVAVLLVLLMLRTVAFEAWYHDPKRQRFWELALAAGSFALAFGFGLLAGNLFAGLPIDARGAWTGSLLTPLRPLPIATGILSAAACLLHGATYLRRKAPVGSTLRTAADRIAGAALPVASGLAAALALAALFGIPGLAARPLFWLGTAGAALAGAGLFRSLRGSSSGGPFAWSVTAFVSTWVAGGAALHPWIIRPGAGAPGLDVAGAASPVSTLAFLAPFTVVALAIVAGYTSFVYRAFKGRPSGPPPVDAGTAEPETPAGREGAKVRYLKCKACGYIIEADRLGAVCPACGVPAKQFEEYDDKVSPKRRRLLELHIHPVIVHAPQATAAFLVLIGLALFLPLGSLRPPLEATATVLAVLLPLTVLAAFLAGLFDGKLRFRRVTTPILKTKMAIGGLFFAASLGACALALLAGFSGGAALAAFTASAAVALGAGGWLGILGAGLMNAKFPG